MTTHRLLTIHNGTQLTPTVINILNVINMETMALYREELPEDATPEMKRARYDEIAPMIATTPDGLVIYVNDRRLG